MRIVYPRIRATALISMFGLLIITLPFAGIAQEANYALPKIIPASPNAASLGKYGENPVSNYTGIPSISIPIYEIRSGNITVPISLNYYAGGIKVEEISSWVGLGWSLNAGGAVTRSMAGVEDFEPTVGYVNQAVTIRNLLQGNVPILQDKLARMSLGLYDGEPDSYFYNFGQYSGKFFYNQEKQGFLFSPHSNLKVEFDTNPSQIRITGPDGLIYYFANVELNKNSYQDATNNLADLKTAWFLSSIEDPKTGAAVTFEYEASNYSYETISCEIETTAIPNECSTSPAASHQNVRKTNLTNTWRLKKIVFRDGYVLFNKASTERCDLPGDYALKSIVVYNNFDEQIKKVELNYSYFEENNTPAGCNSADAYKRRLKLDAVQEVETGAITLSKKPWLFTYIGNGGLVNRLSYSQDFWGYYNAGNILTMLPPAILPSPGGGTELPGADRNALAGYAANGTLESITYPTGGKTTFEFETNTVKGVRQYETQPSASLSALCQYDSEAQLYVFQQHYVVEFTIDETLTGPNNNSIPYMRVATGGYDIRNYFENTGSHNPPGYELTLVNVNNPSVNMVHILETGYGGSAKLLNIERGTYRLTVSFVHDPSEVNTVGRLCEYYGGFNCYVYFPPIISNTFENKAVGGIRIKKMIDSDGIHADNDIVTEYDYSSANEPAFSSGTMQFKPNYSYVAVTANGGSGNSTTCRYLKRFSVSNYPLVTTQGRPVGYARVSVSKKKNGNINGKSVYQYTSFNDFPDDIHSTYPFVPPTTYDQERGLLMLEQHFRYDKDNPNPDPNLRYYQVKEVEYGYESLADLGLTSAASIGIKAGWVVSGTGDIIFEAQLGPDDWNSPLYAIDVIRDEYNIISEYKYMFQKKETLIDDADQTRRIQTITNYKQSKNALLPNETTIVNSMGNEEITTTKYSGDYISNSFVDNTAKGIKGLQDLHIVNEPVEIVSQLKNNNGGTNIVKAAILKTYKIDAPVIDDVFKLKAGTPTSTFLPSDITSGNFIKSDQYEPYLKFSRYDLNGNILQMSKAGDMEQSFIWDYFSNYPIADAQNATYDDIAYTSFEAAGTGNWTFNSANIVSDGITGSKSYNLGGGNISKGSLNINKPYTLSYWAKTGAAVSVSNATAASSGPSRNGWTYYQKTIENTSTVTISGTGVLDEVRIFPMDGQMNSYTYKPLVGATSKSEINNKIIYYEYDDLQRLKLIRDQDRSIIKQLEYKYDANPGPLWTATGNTRCQTGTGGYATGRMEAEERDNNPSSPGYNTLRWADAGNSSTCPVTADWQLTTDSRCQTGTGGYLTGKLFRKELDMNPYSTTYNTPRWIDAGVSTSCPILADWQDTGTKRCILATDEQNTGEQEKQQKQMNPYAASYLVYRWLNTGPSVECPMPVTVAIEFRNEVLDYPNSFGSERTTHDVYLVFKDQAGNPVSVSGLTINYRLVETTNGTPAYTNRSIPVTGTELHVFSGTTREDIYNEFGQEISRFYFSVELLFGVGYRGQ